MKSRDKNKNIDFHTNPLKFVLYNLYKAFPDYLWWMYLGIVALMFAIYFKNPTIIDQTYFSTFNFNTFVSISVTGLSFSLALFVACSHIFDDKDFKTMKNKNLFNKIISPFVVTSFIFLLSGSLSLIAPIFTILNKSNTFKLITVSFILLGLFSLFSTITYVLSLYKKKHKN